MINRIIYILIFLQICTFSFAQTEAQKQMMYERINRDSKGSSILPKIKPIANKEELFNNAQILPVFKVEFDKNNKPQLVQNKQIFLIFYIGRLYSFIGNKDSRYFDNSPVIENIIQFNKGKKELYVVYFCDTFSFDSKFFNPLLSDKSVSFIIDTGVTFEPSDYINLKFGSLEKYKERVLIDSKRDKLTLENFNDYVKNNYEAFHYNCPKDTVLVLNALMSQIRLSTKNFTKNQENSLLKKIQAKINPIELHINQYKQYLLALKISDSEITKKISEAKTELSNKVKEHTKQEGLYEFSVYNTSFTNELLEVLTNEQFTAYKNYYDLMHPVIEIPFKYGNAKYRYGYAKDILEKENILKTNSFQEYNKYVNKVLLDCGCAFDESIKRDLIIK